MTEPSEMVVAGVAWLIEIETPIGCIGCTTLYYCGQGDWCSNPNHAIKFRDLASAQAVADKASTSVKVVEHEWTS